MGARSHLELHTTHKEYHKTFKKQDARAQDVCVYVCDNKTRRLREKHIVCV